MSAEHTEPFLPSTQHQEKSALVPAPHELTVYNTMARQAVQSKMYRGIGDEAGIMMIMLAARELNIPPMQALNGGIHIIDGKVELSARQMNALIRRSGHRIQIKESSDESCTLIGIRGDNGDSAKVTYSVADAQRAGLIREKGGWKKCPADMCFARALSRLARQLFPDCIGSAYVEGEIQVQPQQVQEIETHKEVETIENVPETPAPEGANLEHWKKYCQVVAETFGWDRQTLHKTLQKDLKSTYEKFNKWLQKAADIKLEKQSLS